MRARRARRPGCVAREDGPREGMAGCGPGMGWRQRFRPAARHSIGAGSLSGNGRNFLSPGRAATCARWNSAAWPNACACGRALSSGRDSASPLAPRCGRHRAGREFSRQSANRDRAILYDRVDIEPDWSGAGNAQERANCHQWISRTFRSLHQALDVLHVCGKVLKAHSLCLGGVALKSRDHGEILIFRTCVSNERTSVNGLVPFGHQCAKLPGSLIQCLLLDRILSNSCFGHNCIVRFDQGRCRHESVINEDLGQASSLESVAVKREHDAGSQPPTSLLELNDESSCLFRLPGGSSFERFLTRSFIHVARILNWGIMTGVSLATEIGCTCRHVVPHSSGTNQWCRRDDQSTWSWNRCMNFTEHTAAESPDPSRDAAVSCLLDACFDGAHEGRSWFKQVPHERPLAWSGGDLVGHVGMEFRVVRVGEAIVSVLGIVDLCVAPAARRQGIGAALMQGAEEQARGQSFALAMADDPRLYQRIGYSSLHAPNVTFPAIDELRCHGVIRRDLSEIFMVKALTCDSWPDGPIDLLGHLF